MKSLQSTPLRLLRSPVVILAAIVGGIVTGLLAPDLARRTASLGTVYLHLLKMTVLPILITAIVTSIGRLFGDERVNSLLGRIVLVSLFTLAGTAVLGLSAALIAGPGRCLDSQARAALGRAITAADQAGAAPTPVQGDIFDFLEQLIPENIFQAMGQGSSLEVLFFCILLGAAVGLQQPRRRNSIIDVSDSLFHAFFTIIDWVMYALPLGLFSLLASQMANAGTETLSAMLRFIVLTWAVSLVVIAVGLVTTAWALRAGPGRVLLALRESMLIALGTQSTFASMPALIEGLSRTLRVDRKLVNLVVPLGAVLNRFSMVILYTAATVFAAQLYDKALGPKELGMSLFLSVLAAVAGAGTPGIVSLSLISIVLTPLGLPISTVVILMLAINPVIEPITTVANIAANSGCTALIARLGGATDAEEDPSPDPEEEGSATPFMVS